MAGFDESPPCTVRDARLGVIQFEHLARVEVQVGREDRGMAGQRCERVAWRAALFDLRRDGSSQFYSPFWSL